MDQVIIDFIKAQKCAGICCIEENGSPYCFSCFYAFDPKEGLLYYKTSPESHHARLMSANPIIAGTILQDKLNAMAIQGIQFTGVALPGDDGMAKGASRRYYKRFPFALAMPGEIWTIRVDNIKMTDNTRGFGTKINWQRQVEMTVS